MLLLAKTHLYIAGITDDPEEAAYRRELAAKAIAIVHKEQGEPPFEGFCGGIDVPFLCADDTLSDVRAWPAVSAPDEPGDGQG